MIRPPDASRPAQLILGRFPTPIGEALVVVDDLDVLRALDFADHEPRMRRLMSRHYGSTPLTPGPVPGLVQAALERYFAGATDALAGLAWATNGTPFQREVWTALTTIPPGETRSYKKIAVQVGRPAAVRAVGLANGANPVALVAPCHRVIGADGSLTGYGGGLERKRWLLQHEGAAPFRDRPQLLL